MRARTTAQAQVRARQHWEHSSAGKDEGKCKRWLVEGMGKRQCWEGNDMRAGAHDDKDKGEVRVYVCEGIHV